MTYFNEKFGQSQNRGEVLSLQLGPSVVHTYGDKVWHLHQATIDNNANHTGDYEFVGSCLPNLRAYFTDRLKPRLVGICDRKFLRKGLVSYSEVQNGIDANDGHRTANPLPDAFPLRYCPQECFQPMPTWPDAGDPLCADHCPPVYERIRRMLEDCDRIALLRIYCLSHCANDYWSQLILELLPEICDSFDLLRKVHICPIDGTKLSTVSCRSRQAYYHVKLVHSCLCTVGGSFLYGEEPVDDRDEHVLCSAHVDPIEYFTRELNSPGLFQMTKAVPAGPAVRVFSISRGGGGGGPSADARFPVAQYEERVPDVGPTIVHTYIAPESGRALRPITSQSVLKQMPQAWRAAIRYHDQEESNALTELAELHELLDWYEQM